MAPRCGAPAASTRRPTRRGSRATRPAGPPPLDPGPLLADPAGNLGVITLAGAAGGPLPAPAMAAQQPPHMPRVVADAGEPPDHLGDPRQGPQVGVEPVGFRAGQQGRAPPAASRPPRAARDGPSGPDRPAPPGRPSASGHASGWRSGGRPPAGGRLPLGAGPGRTGGRLAGGAAGRPWGSRNGIQAAWTGCAWP